MAYAFSRSTLLGVINVRLGGSQSQPWAKVELPINASDVFGLFVVDDPTAKMPVNLALAYAAGLSLSNGCELRITGDDRVWNPQWGPLVGAESTHWC